MTTPELGEAVQPYEPVLLNAVTPQVVEDFARLRPQLSERGLTAEEIEYYLLGAVASPETAVFVIQNSKGRIVSTVTGSISHAPYSRKAEVSDVVTDGFYRGAGLADKLMDALEGWFESMGVDSAHLTSNATRLAAGRLYERRGYVQHATRVYQKLIGRAIS